MLFWCFPSGPISFCQIKKEVLPSLEGFWWKRLLSQDGIRRKKKSISSVLVYFLSQSKVFPCAFSLSPRPLSQDLSRPILQFHKAHNTHCLSQKYWRKWRIASICWWFSCFGFLGSKAAKRMGAGQNNWISLRRPQRSKKSLTASVLLNA